MPSCLITKSYSMKRAGLYKILEQYECELVFFFPTMAKVYGLALVSELDIRVSKKWKKKI